MAAAPRGEQSLECSGGPSGSACTEVQCNTVWALSHLGYGYAQVVPSLTRRGVAWAETAEQARVLWVIEVAVSQQTP
jgi:hypothetical protein